MSWAGPNGETVTARAQIHAKQKRNWNVYAVAAPGELPGDYQYIN